MLTTDRVIALARKNIGGAMESSARLCLSDAIEAADRDDIATARKRALDSLRYSVGIFHADYLKAEA